MKHVSFSLVLVFSLLLPFSKGYSQIGLWIDGHLECKAFLSACDQDRMHIDCQAQTSWASGYVSGIAVRESARYERIGNDTVKTALIRHCKKFPLSDTLTGAMNIYYELLSKNRKK